MCAFTQPPRPPRNIYSGPLNPRQKNAIRPLRLSHKSTPNFFYHPQAPSSFVNIQHQLQRDQYQHHTTRKDSLQLEDSHPTQQRASSCICNKTCNIFQSSNTGISLSTRWELQRRHTVQDEHACWQNWFRAQHNANLITWWRAGLRAGQL